MALANVNLGSGPSAGDGSPLRTAFGIINNNFAQLQTNISSLTNSVTTVAGRTGNVVLTVNDIVGLSGLYPNNSTISTWISANIAALVGTAPTILDTLGEIADAINNDANVYTTLVNSITSANVAMKGYVDFANTVQAGAILAANLGIIGYVDSAVTTANIGVVGYIDDAVTTANVGVVGYVDSAVTTANLGMKGYVDSQSHYSNINLKSYLSVVDMTVTPTANLTYDLGSTTNRWNNAYVGNVNVTGSILSGNIIPQANVAYSLGNVTHQWKDLYLSGNTMYIGGATLSVSGGYINTSLPIAGNLQTSNLTITGANISFQGVGGTGTLFWPDNTEQTTAWTGSVSSLVNGAYTLGLEADGTTTFPVGVSIDNQNGDPFVIIRADEGKSLTLQAQGNVSGGAGILWQSDNDFSANTGTASVGVSNSIDGRAKVTFQVTSYDPVGTPSRTKTWVFDEDGDLTFPDASVQITAWNESANAAIIGYADNAVTTANSAVVGYIDDAVTTANVGMKGYVDSQAYYSNVDALAYLTTNSYATESYVDEANIGMIGYVDNAVTTANIGIIGYIDSQAHYSNVNLASYDGNIQAKVNGYDIGYRNIPQVTAGNVTLTLADSGKHYYATSAAPLTLTVPSNANVAFPIGTAISIVNKGSANLTIDLQVEVSMYLAGNATSDSRTITSYGMATVMKTATDEWFINGTGVA